MAAPKETPTLPRQLAKLARPFPDHLVLTREVGGNRKASYVRHAEVTTKLLLVIGPYDWSGVTTPLEAWIGGHSQRGKDEGSPPARLRRLIDPDGQPPALTGWRIVGEADDVPWTIRSHERSFTEYRVHLLALRKNIAGPTP